MGGYLILSKKDWPLIESIVSVLVASLSVPVHVKMRLCSPPHLTVTLASRIAQSGASVITLHARHVSARRRRKGAAELRWVAEIVRCLKAQSCETRVVSNGNVRQYQDLLDNLKYTGEKCRSWYSSLFSLIMER